MQATNTCCLKTHLLKKKRPLLNSHASSVNHGNVHILRLRYIHWYGTTNGVVWCCEQTTPLVQTCPNHPAFGVNQCHMMLRVSPGWEWHKSLVAFQRLCQYMSSLDCCPDKFLMSTCGHPQVYRDKRAGYRSTNEGHHCYHETLHFQGSRNCCDLLLYLWCVITILDESILNFNPIHFLIHLLLGLQHPQLLCLVV